LEFSYDLKAVGQQYTTATNLAIFPENCPLDVVKAAQLAGLELDQRFALVPNPNSKKGESAKHPFPTPTTVREALTSFVDLHGPLRKKLLKDLSEHCQDPDDKNELVKMSTVGEYFHEQVEKPQLGFLQILERFNSLDLNLEQFFQLAPRIMPRYYTIASSSLLYPEEVRIAVSLTTDVLPSGQKKMGLTSSYLSTIFEELKSTPN